MSADVHAREVASGDRFAFGSNWAAFLAVLDEPRIGEAVASLREMLGAQTLEGRTFLDAGSGSGLFSLAAMRLGADRVHSFDFDPASVGCTAELRRRHYPGDERWSVEQASVLDPDYLAGLGQWDVVYSWGVLHHTGDMWRALGHVDRHVADDGRLFVSIYNDQGLTSRWWRLIKRGYNALPAGLRTPYALLVAVPRELLSVAAHLARGRPLDYVRTWTQYRRSRGMSRWHDIVDWVGGYPFEVASPQEIFAFYRARGYRLEALVTRQGRGCNEFVFRR